MRTVRLGLIGDNIATSRAPDLHHAAARICGIDVVYERLVPRNLGLHFEGVVERAQRHGFRGLNITHPYKESVVRLVTVADPTVNAIGACNTVLFGEPTVGLNTDYTGYISAFRGRFHGMQPGMVAMAGSGGVGKAVAFALVQLGAKSLTLFDVDAQKSNALVAAVKHQKNMTVRIAPSLYDACDGADALINCTPLGMSGYRGNAFDGIRLKGRAWIFDAVYTPVRTPFVKEGELAGVEVLSGYELFLYQGIHAFELFTGLQVDAGELRLTLQIKSAS